MILSKVYEDAENRLERNEITLGEFERLVDIEVIEPKRGEWIEDYNNTYGQCRMKCSVCGKFSGIGGIKSNQRKPFCPNCGADMREREGE